MSSGSRNKCSAFINEAYPARTLRAAGSSAPWDKAPYQMGRAACPHTAETNAQPLPTRRIRREPCEPQDHRRLGTRRPTKWVGRRVLRQPKQMLSLYQRGVSGANLTSRRIIGALGQGALAIGRTACFWARRSAYGWRTAFSRQIFPSVSFQSQ